MRPWAVAVAGLAVLGIGLRLWVTHGDMALLDADEGVVGLQALRAAEGDQATFFLGQAYGGTLEALLASIPVRFVGGETAALRVTAGAISLCSVVLLHLLARRTLPDRRAAWLSAAILFAWPPVYVWFGTRTMGFYASSLALGLALCLLVAVMDEDRRWWWPALLGLVAGLAWWQSPYVAYFAVPSLAWLVARGRWSTLARLPLALPTALVGAAPWLLANVGEGFPSLDAGTYGGYAGTYFGKVAYVLHTGLPVAMGLKIPFTQLWSDGEVGRVTYLVLLAGLTALVAWGLRQRRLAAFGLVAFPFVYALNPVGSTTAHGRYFLFLSPWLALLAGELAARARPRLVAVVAAVAVTSVLGVRALQVIGWRAALRPSTQELAEALLDDGIRHVHADYFLAYKLAFESDGDVRVAPFQAVRDHDDRVAVRAAPRSAYVFSVGDGALQRVRDGLDRLGVPFDERLVGGDYVVVVPSRPVQPEELDDEPLGF